MKKNNYIHFVLAISISCPTFTYADIFYKDHTSSEYFVSNNTNTIDLQTAFNRMVGEAQEELEDSSIRVMQKEHFEQSKLIDILGTYKMSSSQNITADNSEKIITSSYQRLSSKKIFKFAQELADTLKQESVAVFVPSKITKVGDTILKLKSHNYTINEIITIIHEKLPPQYQQAFSLHLKNTNDFNNAFVDEVEWLGSQSIPDEIQNSFPNEDVIAYYGTAYLVYQNGEKERL